MPSPSQAKPFPTVLQPTDVIFGDQDTGTVDASGNKIFASRGFPGSLFGSGNGAVQLPPATLLGNPPGSGAANFGQPITLSPNDFMVDGSLTLNEVPSVADNLTAQGSLQTDALQLTALVNFITTVNPNTGVRMLAVPMGKVVEVWNLGAHPLAFYPLGGGVIGSGSVNASVLIFPGSVLRFRVRVATAGATQLLAG